MEESVIVLLIMSVSSKLVSVREIMKRWMAESNGKGNRNEKQNYDIQTPSKIKAKGLRDPS